MAADAQKLEIVSRWFGAMWGASCDLNIVDELAAPDVLLQYSMNNPRLGRHAVKLFMAGFREAFPDLAFRIVGDLIAAHDIVVVRWDGKGTHTGPALNDFNVGPLPRASGRKLLLSGLSAVRLDDCVVVEEAVWSSERKAKFRCIAGGLSY